MPNFDKEAREAIAYEGLPPLTPNRSATDITVFSNVKSIYTAVSGAVQLAFSAKDEDMLGVVVTRNGSVICSGAQSDCLWATMGFEAHFIDLEGGSISPGLTSFGSPLGLEHINQEDSTNDGEVYDPILEDVPKVLGGETSIVRAVDGLQYESRDALYVDH